jgi:hypothetical protein
MSKKIVFLNMITIKNSNKLEGVFDYGICKVKIRIVLMKDLWD